MKISLLMEWRWIPSQSEMAIHAHCWDAMGDISGAVQSCLSASIVHMVHTDVWTKPSKTMEVILRNRLSAMAEESWKGDYGKAEQCTWHPR